MDTARFQRAAELFEQLRTLPEEQRGRSLAGERDGEVRRMVAELLAQHDRAESGQGESLLAAGAALRQRLGVRDGAGPVEPAAEQPLPTRVGRFAIRGEIARGGIGVVLRADDDRIGRDVAVKVLRAEYADHPAMVRRLHLEGRIGGRLQHPAIVPVYELGHSREHGPFLVMKVVEGRTLAAILAERHGAAGQRQRLLAVFEQVCQAMGYAHARGVLHRDLKPHNLMVGTFGEVQVMDWGLAKEVDGGGAGAGDAAVAGDGPEPSADLAADGAEQLSRAGTAMGTPGYMAPEQARGQVATPDPRLDVFGLGAILCEILTGAPPFDGAGTGTVLEQARAGDLTPALRRLEACGADPELVGLARRCLAADPARRPEDAGVVAVALRAHLDSVEERARSALVQATAAEARAAAEHRARRRTTVLGAAVVLMVLLGAALWLAAELDAQQRRQQAAERLRNALVEVDRVVADARAAEPQVPARWQAAVAAARNARRLVSEEVDRALRDRVAELVASCERRLDDLTFAQRLEGIALDARLLSQALGATEVSAYREAFAARLGADLIELGAERAAARLSGFAYPESLLRGLDAWALAEYQVNPQSVARRTVVTTGKLLDDDAWRNRLRDAALTEDREVLLALAESFSVEDLPAYSAVTLALHLYVVGERQAALRVLQAAQREHPGDFEVTWNLALLHGDRSNTIEYLRLASAAVAQQPRSSLAHMLLADALVAYERYPEAIAAAREAVRLSRDDMAKHIVLMRVLFAAGRFDEAAALLETLGTDVDESHSVFPLFTGYCAVARLHQGRTDEALEWLQRGVRNHRRHRHDPPLLLEADLSPLVERLEARGTQRDAYDDFLLGRLHYSRGRLAQALRAFEAAALRDPDLPWVMSYVAEIRQRLQDVTTSHATVDAALARLDADVERDAARRAILGHSGSAATGSDAHRSVVRYAEARLAERAGERDEAIALLERAIPLDPEALQPWRRWHALAAARDGWESADRALRARIAALQPARLIDVAPAAPGMRADDPVALDGSVTLRIARPAVPDPRYAYAATHWQVRRLPDGDYDLAPAVDMVTGPETELRIPRGVLVGGGRYAWRARCLVAEHLESPFGAEQVVEVPEAGPRPVPLSLRGLANADVVGDRGDADGDHFDLPNRYSLVADGYDPVQSESSAAVRGLPRDLRIGVHRLLPFDGHNAVALETHRDVRVELPPGRYSAIRGLVAAANGHARVPAAVLYEDGTTSAATWFVPDWFASGTGQGFGSGQSGTPVWRAMDRIGPEGIEQRDEAKVYECYLPVEPGRRAVAIILDGRSMGVSGGNTAAWLLALTAMTTGGP